MTEIVVEVGPAIVRGPNAAPAQWVTAAVECIDDDIAVVDDRPVSVAELWRGVLGDVVGGYGDAVVLVLPTWWTSSRIDVVRRAADGIAGTVVVRQRAPVLRDGLPGRSITVVEVAQDFVVVSPGAGELAVMPRRGVADVDAVMREVGVVAAAVVDVAEGVDGVLGSQIAERLRANGIVVTVAGSQLLRRVAVASPRREATMPAVYAVPTIPRRRASAVMAGALVAGAVLCGGFATRDDPPAPPDAVEATTLLVEGRVGMAVPAQWPVERVTSGPGSARVQIISPSESDVVVHLTQSALPPGETQATAAESLRQALSEQPPGIFVDFDPADRRAGKAAVTYREVRRDHHIAWVVLIDDDLRIAIGCQSAPGRESLVRDACDQAVQSAHAVF